MRAKSWEYLAGIMDGEGCFSINFTQRRSKKTGRPYLHFGLGISVYQQDIRLMKWLVHHFGGQYYRDKKKGERNPGWAWHAPTGERGKQWIRSLIPYLLLKQEQAKLALEYMQLGRKIDPGHRRWLADRCSALNGDAPTTNTPDGIVPPIPQKELFENGPKIESELVGDNESDPEVIQ